jgi:hypothetical protein
LAGEGAAPPWDAGDSAAVDWDYKENTPPLKVDIVYDGAAAS